MVWIPALAEVGLAAAAFGPFLMHRLSVGRWRKTPLLYPKSMQAESKHPLTVVLPVWNEALIIEKKLENLAAQDGKKPSLLIIDSASTDDTVKRIQSWLKTNQGAFEDSTVIEMERRQGKTKALQMALESLEANTYEGLICMTDADAQLKSNALQRLQGCLLYTSPSPRDS